MDYNCRAELGIPRKARSARRAKAKKRRLIITALMIISAMLLLSLCLTAPYLTLYVLLMLPESSVFESVTFQESEKYFPNPFMGPVAPAHMMTRELEGTLAVGGFSWRDIEENKGIFDFTAAEEAINYEYWVYKEKNQFMLGMVLDYPTLSPEIGFDQIDIPLWMYEELKSEAESGYLQLLNDARERGDLEAIFEYEEALYLIQNDREVIDDFNHTLANTADIPGVGTFYRWSMEMPAGGIQYRGGFSPNYNSPLLLEHHNLALKAVAERYDNQNTFIILMTSLGHWGEPHTYYITEPNATGQYPSKEIASRYEEKYAEYFQHVFVSSRMPREVARDNNFGLHNHAFGDPQHTYDWFLDYYTNGYTSYHTGDTFPAMPDFWKKAPSGGEFLYTGDQRFLSNELIGASIQMARDTYITWFNEPYYHMTEEARDNLELFYSKIGYRFTVEFALYNPIVKAGNPMMLQIEWRNRGTAPFYRDWPIILQMRDLDGTVVISKEVESSVQQLLPGMIETYTVSINVPHDLEPNNYQLWVGIVNPETGIAEVQLTMADALTKENMLFLGDVEITQSNLFSELRHRMLSFITDIAGFNIG